MADERLSLADAAARLGISVEAVRLRLRRGSLPGVKVGGRWFALVDERLVVPGQASADRLVATSQRLDTGTDATEQAPSQAARVPGHDQLSAHLQAEVTFLRAQLEQAAVERAELRRLVAAALPGLPAGPSELHENPPVDAEPAAQSRRSRLAFWRR